MARQSFTAFDAICAAGTLVASGWVVYEAHQDGLRSTRGSRPAPDAAFTQTTRLLRPEHMIAMQRDGFVLIPNALSALQLKDARAAVSALRLGQEFHHSAFDDGRICHFRPALATRMR